MTATTSQPNNTVDDPSVYKGKIDANFAVHNAIAGAFAVHEAAVPDMTVVVDAGTVQSAGSAAVRASQITAAFVAPVTLDMLRIDVVGVSDITGDHLVVEGVEDLAAPVAPVMPDGYRVCAHVNLAYGQTTITNVNIDDVRAFMVTQPTLDSLGAASHQSIVRMQTRNWTGYAAPQSGGWSSAAFAPELGLYAAVSTAGASRIMTSPDGRNWTLLAAPGANSWASITWAAALGLFVAVSYDGLNRVMTSDDGVTWTLRSAAENNPWIEVKWSPELGRLVAIAGGGTNRVMTSDDAITWTARVAAEQNDWRAVAWSSTRGFVAVATDGVNQVMTSPDGITWTARAAALARQWLSVTWSPERDLFLAVSSSSVVMSSADGITWAWHVSFNAVWTSVVWASEPGIFLAVSSSGSNDAVMISFDGTTWIAQPAIAASRQWQSVAWVAERGVFLALSGNGPDDVMLSL
jgi:hypothetical protein